MIYRNGLRRCPHCGGELQSRQVSSYTYEQCKTCHGLWVSITVIYEMLAEIEPALELGLQRVAGAPGNRCCPDCQTPMARVTMFRIPVEYCEEKNHGVWFDKDELGQVLERVALEEPPPPEPPTSFTSLLEDFYRR